MKLLTENRLDPKRGDVIIFNNTSAEHPATYEFARKMKELAEREYNIPFFWVEYQTYEDAGKHGWRRNNSYRLVNAHPYSDDNPNGYRHKGEAYEEMVSLSGFLPNMQSRVCTQTLKIFTTNSFLMDWFAQKPGIERLGHHYDTVQMTDDEVVQMHKGNNGSTPDDILLQKRTFVRQTPFVREACEWADFTDSKLCFANEAIKDCVVGDRGQLCGKSAIAYISYIGIRKDEEIRAEKIRARIDAAPKRKSTSAFNQPSKESVLTPLIDGGITKADVVEFWINQQFDLDLSGDGLHSNCVYCPLKGKLALIKIAANELKQGKSNKDDPASIDWWIDMETNYCRDLKAEERSITSDDKGIRYIGFFGATDTKLMYQQIKAAAQKKNGGIAVDSSAEYFENESYTPCNCTD